ncbi:MAG: type IV pilus modification PilV family protein [Candidatus Acidiferrales bacterium]
MTLLETLIATLVLMVGLLSLAGVLGLGLSLISTSEWDFIAQQKAAEAVETIFTARDTGQLTWAQIQNVGAGGAGPGLFLTGAQPLLAPGPDGIVGTADDDPKNPDCIVSPGPDGILGTADDIKIPLNNFTRTIAITQFPGNANLRVITVTMNYRAGRFNKTYTLVTYISAFA